MKKTQNYVMRQVIDEFVLVRRGEAAERISGTMTLSETAAFIYEHLEAVKTSEEIIPADILSFLLPAVSFLSTEIRGGCKTQWHAYFSPMPIDGLRQTFQLQR